MNQVKKEFQKKDEIIFVSYFHPDELLDNKSGIYSLEYMNSNIRNLLETSARLGADVEFIRAKDIKDRVKQYQSSN